jgi:hypothetical protein
MEGQKPEPIEELRKRYKDEWLVVLVTKHDRYGLPSEGILLARCPDKKTAWEFAASVDGELYVFFAGPTIPEGWGAVLHAAHAL